MKHLNKFSNFIFESNNEINIIEDCLLEFCDKYNLDPYVDMGYLINNSFVTEKMMPEIKKMAADSGIDIHIEKVYRVQLYSKRYRDESRHVVLYDKLPTLLDKWDDNINIELKSCVSRIIEMSDLKVNIETLPELKQSYMGITFYLNFPNIG